MKKTIKSLEEELKTLRKKYRELRDSYNQFYNMIDGPRKRELWHYKEPMDSPTTRELFLSVHSADVLGYDCILTAEGACTPNKKLNVTFVQKRPDKPLTLILANYAV